MDIRHIRTGADSRIALKEVAAGMSCELPDPGRPKGDTLDGLAIPVRVCEARHLPVTASDPRATIPCADSKDRRRVMTADAPGTVRRIGPCQGGAAAVWLAGVLTGCAAPHQAVAPPEAAVVFARPTGVPPARVQPLVVAPPSASQSVASVATPPARPQAAAAVVQPTPQDVAETTAAAAQTPAAPVLRSGQAFARGMASWYGPRFHGRRTASGERYDKHALTAAHKTLPFGTRVRVRSVHTGREVVVRINDRGPYQHRRIIDLSRAAMVALGTLERGVTEVELLRE